MSADTRLANWFEHRHWRVREEVSGGVTDPESGVTVTYDRGVFSVEPPGVFMSPLGHRGRTGYLIERTDGDGSETRLQAAFGESTLRRAQDAYGTVTGLPATAS